MSAPSDQQVCRSYMHCVTTTNLEVASPLCTAPMGEKRTLCCCCINLQSSLHCLQLEKIQLPTPTHHPPHGLFGTLPKSSKLHAVVLTTKASMQLNHVPGSGVAAVHSAHGREEKAVGGHRCAQLQAGSLWQQRSFHAASKHMC